MGGIRESKSKKGWRTEGGMGWRRGEPKITHFIKQFVDNDEVITNRLFFQSLEVGGEYLDKFVKEQESKGNVRIAGRDGKNCVISERGHYLE